jgi:adenosylmethionine-8-amino-7-oxononanoate aminotransferase
MFALEHDRVDADIVVVAKGLAGGYQPLGAVLASNAVVNAIRSGSGMLANGHTYMGHPVACAAGVAVLDVMRDQELVGAVRERGPQIEELLHRAFRDHPMCGDIRGRGFFWSVEFVKDQHTKEPIDPALGFAQSIKACALKRGLICYPSPGSPGGNSDHVLLAPPYICTSAQLVDAVEILRLAVDEAAELMHPVAL